jgi:hypothetical protein
MDRATGPWNSGSGIRTGSIPFISKEDERIKAGEFPPNNNHEEDCVGSWPEPPQLRTRFFRFTGGMTTVGTSIRSSDRRLFLYSVFRLIRSKPRHWRCRGEHPRPCDIAFHKRESAVHSDGTRAQDERRPAVLAGTWGKNSSFIVCSTTYCWRTSNPAAGQVTTYLRTASAPSSQSAPFTLESA